MAEAVRCEDGAEVGGEHRVDLSSEKQYDNFELVFDFKLSPNGNSGIKYLGEEIDYYMQEDRYAHLRDWQGNFLEHQVLRS